MGVGIFYSRFRLPQAAVKRFEGVLAEYPDFSGNDELLYRLAVAYRRLDRGEEADQTLARLRESYPASDWTRRAAKEAG
jgi:outer membrane protein assembly factor BamD